MNGDPAPNEVWHEAWTDWTSQGLRSAALLAVVVAVFLATALVEGFWADEAWRQEQEFVQAGGYTLVVFDEGSTIDSVACDALAESPYIIASGGYVETPSTRIRRTPGSRYTTHALTLGGLAVAAPGQSLAGTLGGVVLGPTVARDLSLEQGQQLWLDDQLREVVGVVDDNALRLPGLGRSVITVGRTPSVTRCLARVDREAAGQAAGLVAAQLGVRPALVVAPFTERGDFAQSPSTALAERPQRQAGTAAGLALGTLLALDVWTRRQDLAVARLTGGSFESVAAIQAVTRLQMLLVAAVASAGVAVTTMAVTTGALLASQTQLMLRQIAMGLAAASLVSVIGVLWTTRSATFDTLRDR